MRYQASLIVVKEMARSKAFYRAVLGLEVIADFGTNVTLSGGITLQTLATWKDFIHRREDEIVFGAGSSELYFQEDDMAGFLQKLSAIPDIVYVHPPMTHRWGQCVVRFYDPDQHIIEVGENLDLVVRRFVDSGLTPAETAERMDVSLEYVRACLC